MIAPSDTIQDGVISEHVTKLSAGDLSDIVDACTQAIVEGGGFGWLTPPDRPDMEKYWRGVLLMPGRHLFVSRVDGVISGAAQLIETPSNLEAQRHSAQISGHFVAPWARGRGNGKAIVRSIEYFAREAGYSVLKLDLRETQTAAIALYNGLGYVRWGINPYYAMIDGKMVEGYYYTKKIQDTDQ
ncbi:GNAT family N-acetyltransferase [Thalassospira sp.]|uniref:GNAT family N-acetyltransferase n=1 Tax=Thalassospira sp. TaxID=1912094 RepID=UPI0032EB8473